MSLVNALRTKDTFTENGMVTHSTSLSAVLDFFSTAGAMRTASESQIKSRFYAAFGEDRLLAMKSLFWARDIRGGAGERRLFRILLKSLAKDYPKVVINNLRLIGEFGRWDDALELLDTEVSIYVLDLIKQELGNRNGLCAKWMPRKGDHAKKLRNYLKLSPKDYRKTLVELTNVVETKMCQKEWKLIEYPKVPSLAMSRYTKAFSKNDQLRFGEYLASLAKGEVKINVGAVYPYDIVKSLKHGNKTAANEQWKHLPNYLENSKERVLPVCDVSGSMETRISGETTAMDVCVSLGLYISERNEGIFKDAFVTFSDRPKLQYLKGDLNTRYRSLATADWGGSTNIEATFNLILEKAVENRIKESEMPTMILIMSDMEFNSCTSRRNDTSMDMIKRKYTEAGYTIPKIVFWNLCSRNKNSPVQKDEKNAFLVSGFSPAILKSVLTGKNSNPLELMLEVLNSPRYSMVETL